MLVAGESANKKKEPRPPIRVEAPPPRWTRLTWAVWPASVGRRVPPCPLVSALLSAQPDRPTGPPEGRNVVSQSAIGYPSEPLPSATALRRWLVFIFYHHYTSLCRDAHRSMGPSSTCTFGQCPFVRLASGSCLFHSWVGSARVKIERGWTGIPVGKHFKQLCGSEGNT